MSKKHYMIIKDGQVSTHWSTMMSEPDGVTYEITEAQNEWLKKWYDVKITGWKVSITKPTGRDKKDADRKVLKKKNVDKKTLWTKISERQAMIELNEDTTAIDAEIADIKANY